MIQTLVPRPRSNVKKDADVRLITMLRNIQENEYECAYLEQRRESVKEPSMTVNLLLILFLDAQ